MKTIKLIACGMLVLCLLHMPGGYYTLLRLVVTAASVVSAIEASNKKETVWSAIFVVVALLFNPFIPVYFHDRGIWIPIDLTVAVLLFIRSRNS